MSKNKKNSKYSYSWKLIFVTVVCVISMLVSVWSLILVNRQQSSLKSLESFVEQCLTAANENDEEFLKSNSYIETYPMFVLFRCILIFAQRSVC